MKNNSRQQDWQGSGWRTASSSLQQLFFTDLSALISSTLSSGSEQRSAVVKFRSRRALSIVCAWSAGRSSVHDQQLRMKNNGPMGAAPRKALFTVYDRQLSTKSNIRCMNAALYEEQQHGEQQKSMNMIGRQPISSHAMFVQLTDKPNKDQLLHCRVEPCCSKDFSVTTATHLDWTQLCNNQLQQGDYAYSLSPWT